MVHTVVWHDLLIISLSQLRIIRSQTLITCISVYPQGTHIFKFIPQLFSNLLSSPKPSNSYSIACSALKPNSCSGVLVTYSRRSIWGSSLTFDWSTTRVYWEIGDFGRVWLGLSICFYLLSQYFIKAWTNEKCQEFHGLSRQKVIWAARSQYCCLCVNSGDIVQTALLPTKISRAGMSWPNSNASFITH